MMDSLTALVRRRIFKLANMPGFDPDFYKSNHPDLAHLQHDWRLREHYVIHGSREGRPISLAMAREQLSARGQIAPDDFDVIGYRLLNPDLGSLLDTDWHFERHYIEHGRGEGRPYKWLADEDFAWSPLFILGDFLLFSAPWRREDPRDRRDAMRMFLEQGVPRLTPLARDHVFDPLFYCQNYFVQEKNPEELYRHWLDYGIKLGRVANERQAILHLLGGKPYPSCLDWKRVVGDKASAPVYPRKIEALQQIFEWSPGRSRRFISGAGAAGLLAAMGDHHLSAGTYPLAIEAYDLAAAAGGHDAMLFHHRGDARRMLGQVGAAIDDYDRAASFAAHPVWAVHHKVELIRARRIKCAASSGATSRSRRLRDRASVEDGFGEVAAILKAAHGEWAGDPIHRDLVDKCIEARFQEIVGALAEALREGDIALGQAAADRELRDLSDLIASLKVSGARLVERSGRRVAMLACLDVPQCTHYRVEQKKEQLALHGVDLDVVDFNDPAAFMRGLAGASAAIFYRVPAYPKIVEAILYARALGIPTYYEIDDLIFTEDFPDTFASYEGQISFDQYLGLQHGVPLYRHAIGLCDFGLASTRPLVAKLAPLVRSGVAHLVPNGLDTRNESAIRAGAMPTPKRDTVTLFYGSGTRAHNQDFTDNIGPALVRLFEMYPELRFTLVGHLSLDRCFDAYRDRIDRHPFVPNVEKYWSLLATADINIAVLSEGAAADCKSEIKWLEAAVLAIPSVVSPTATYRDVLDAPAEALFAQGGNGWEKGLAALIGDPSRRRAIGEAARVKALRDYAPSAVSSMLLDALRLPPRRSPSDDESPAPRPKPAVRGPCRSERFRILICNVFFAPQTHGGATRVVECNVDHLIDRHGDEFEVAILATDVGASADHFRVDSYRGRPVFRIGTPRERNMDWRPFNADNVARFEHVLDVYRPDIVHFHCIQRLTASIVTSTLRRGIPYLVTVHDGWWLSDYQFLVDQHDMAVDIDRIDASATTPVGVARLESLERRQGLRGLLQGAYATLAVSRPFEAIHRAAGLTNTRTIENGLSPLPAPLPATTARGKLVLGHIGGRSAHKGAHLVEVALTQHVFRNLELVMIDGSVEYGTEVPLSWGRTPVTLKGLYPQNEIARLFASFDVLLAPSIWPESYGLVTREADHYGKWIVASRLGAIGADVEDGRTGFTIDVTDTDDLVRVLKIMDDDPIRFKCRPPRTTAVRTADRQGEELVETYREMRDNHGVAMRTAGIHRIATCAKPQVAGVQHRAEASLCDVD